MGSGVLSKIHCVAVIAAGLLAGAGVPDSQSAFEKLSAIEAGARRGARISFSPSELNAWMREEAKVRVPHGVRNVRLDLTSGGATGYADIDFLKVRQAATGQEAGWLLKNLFAGERPVVVKARFESQNGRARVEVDRVEISGIPIEGRTLDFVVENYVRPTFPDVKVNEWFGLRYGIDHFTIAQPGVTVVMHR